jgi:flagellar basal body-associated protein FliL
MPRKGSHADENAEKSPPASKRGGRPATGVSFVVTIALACLATVLVILWTVRSSQEKRGHVGPSGFRM